MNRSVDLLFPATVHERLIAHLFPGDRDEHAAILTAGVVRTDIGTRLLVRDLIIAEEGVDYRPSPRGYKALQPAFIHRAITRCRDQRLAYLAVHNHGGRGSVAFSAVDLGSHERGYPALQDIAKGMPVGALVVAEGAMEIDLWVNDTRLSLREGRVMGRTLQTLYANERVKRELHAPESAVSAAFDRQVLMLGEVGQGRLRHARVAIVGLGGVGALVNEYLSRLGVGTLLLVDPDRVELTNLSRVVGARVADLHGVDGAGRLKVEIAAELAGQAPTPPLVTALAGDFAIESVATQMRDFDFVFLAADSMRARLVFNALVHQYYVPGIQLGSKIRANPDTGALEQAFSVVRTILPGEGCLLCNGFIDAAALSREWQTEDERRQADYGTTLPNPSVITMNAVAAAHGVNEFLFFYLGLRAPGDRPPFLRFDHLTGRTAYDQPRSDPQCRECSSSSSSRFGRGDAERLPCGIG